MQHEDTGYQTRPTEKEPQFRGVYLLAAIVSLCLFLHPAVARAQACGIPYLDQAFAQSPCAIPPPTIPPGTTFQQYLQTWWTGQMVPNLQNMTAQLYAYRIWETYNLGGLMDSQIALHDIRLMQEQRVTAQQGMQPDEQTCVAGSSVPIATETALNAAALTQGFKQDLLRRAHNAVQQQQSDGSYSPPGMTPASDLKARWSEFCQEFYDPNSNGGQGGCQGASAGPVMNDDISIESFLFRDTIDLNNQDVYKAAEALLINIVQPTIHENVFPAVMNSPQGQEYVLRLQHLEALRNVAADVVGSMISRRAPLPQNDKNLAQQIVDIRTHVGIPQCPQSPTPAPGGACYSQTPSYNEIMLALSKERFFDPAYFVNMESNPGAIQQEQAAIDGYTTVQLQDIYKLQEQINALLAARASLKLSTDTQGSQAPSAPN
jgi:hypothetical protein